MDVKAWLESTGLKTAELSFLNPPEGEPYLVFVDQVSARGADNKVCIQEHDLIVELYADRINPDAEARVEGLLDAVGYEKQRYWVESERFYQTVYNTYLIEKRQEE